MPSWPGTAALGGLMVASLALAPGAGHRGLREGQPRLQEESADSVALLRGRQALDGGDPVAAIPLLEEATRLAPETVEPWFYLGLAQLRVGDAVAAEAALRRARRVAGDFDPAIAYQLGVALMRQERPAAARARFEDVLATDPSAVMPRLNLAWTFLQENRGETALEIYEEILADHPDEALAHYYVGFVHQADGRFDRARKAHERALASDPELVEAILALGRLDLAQGDMAGARQRFRRATRLRPDLAEGHFRLGEAALRAGDIDEAIAALERALSLDPEHQGAAYNLALALARAGRAGEGAGQAALFATLRQAEGRARSERLRSQAVSRADARRSRGIEALERGDPGTARDEFLAALDLAGDEALAETWLGLGSALLELGEPGRARDALESAIGLDPELASAWRLLAGAFDALDLPDEAERARRTYRRLLERRRKSGP